MIVLTELSLIALAWLSLTILSCWALEPQLLGIVSEGSVTFSQHREVMCISEEVCRLLEPSISSRFAGLPMLLTPPTFEQRNLRVLWISKTCNWFSLVRVILRRVDYLFTQSIGVSSQRLVVIIIDEVGSAGWCNCVGWWWATSPIKGKARAVLSALDFDGVAMRSNGSMEGFPGWGNI